MIIKEQELKDIILFIIKNNNMGFTIENSSIIIKDTIEIEGTIHYAKQSIPLKASFLLDYKNNKIRLYNIKGTVKLGPIKAPITKILSNFVKVPSLIISNDEISYPILLPISTITILEHALNIEIENR